MDKFHTTYDPITRIWSGRPSPALFHPNANVGQMLLNSLANRPNHIGQISINNGMQLTNRQLQINTIRVAQNLEMLGIKCGDVVGIAANNHHHLASVVFGLLALAAPVSTMHPEFKSGEFSHVLRQTLPKLIICDFECLSSLRKSLTEIGLDVPVFTFGEIQDGTRSVDELLIPTGVEHNFVPTHLIDGSAQTAIIVCSSGTMGLLKAIKISHAMMLNHMYKVFYTTAEDIFASFGSLFWISGFMALVSPTLSGSTRIISTHTLSSESLIEVIKTHRVNSMFIKAFSLQLLTQRLLTNPTDLPSIERFHAGGTPVPQSLRQLVKQLLPNCKLLVSYGLSEFSGIITSNIVPQTDTTSVGQLMPGIRMRLVNEACKSCGPNEIGDLWAKTDWPLLGYVDNAKAMEKAMDSSGWFLTEDVARFDDDNELFIIDRRNDLLYTNHFHISPTHLESVVLGAKGVREVCVVGLSVSGINQLPAALVVQNKQEYIVTEEEINDLFKDKFNDAHQLHGGVYFVNEIPKTYSGKMLRREAVKIATDLYNKRNKIR